MTTIELPKWFLENPDTMRYEEGDVVTNPYSGESYELTADELAMYDFIIGLQTIIDLKGGAFHQNTFKYQKVMRKGLDWFRKANAEAYMVLLD